MIVDTIGEIVGRSVRRVARSARPVRSGQSFAVRAELGAGLMVALTLLAPAAVAIFAHAASMGQPDVP